jgi:hypothetical protein
VTAAIAMYTKIHLAVALIIGIAIGFGLALTLDRA